MMLLPKPGPNPVIPAVPVAVQVYVGPATLEFSVMDVELPEQIVCPLGVKRTFATG
jgi:hypothetical protein